MSEGVDKRKRRSQAMADRGARAFSRTPARLRPILMRGPQRRVILRTIFRMMGRQFDPSKAAGLNAVVRWDIAGRGSRRDRWQLAIQDGQAHTSRTLDREPSLTISLDGDRFLELVTGAGNGPAMFMAGQLKIEGDLALATRLQSLFRLPRRRE